jgi:hypothetical protein
VTAAGPVKDVDDEGFRIEDNGDGWKYCGWRGTVGATPDDNMDDLPSSTAWKEIWSRDD